MPNRKWIQFVIYLTSLAGAIALLTLFVSEGAARSIHIPTNNPPTPTNENADRGLGFDPVWQQIELAYNQGDQAKIIELARQLPADQQNLLIRDIEPSPGNPVHPDNAPVTVPFIGLNGSACAFSNFESAMAAANAHGATLYINQGTHPGRIGLINKNLAFVSADSNCTKISSNPVVIDANAEAVTFGGVAQIAAGTHVTMTGMILQYGSAILGGILYASENSSLSLFHTTLTSGTTSQFGGGIRVYHDATVLIDTGSSVDHNSTTNGGDGGGIAIEKGLVRLINGNVTLNNSSDVGGGILLNGGSLILSNASKVSANTSVHNGGGIFASNGAQITLSQLTTVDNNQTGLDGGGVFLQGSTTSLTMKDDSQIIQNHAKNNGGGVYVDDYAHFLMNSTKVNGNSAEVNGGGVIVRDMAVFSMAGASQVNNNRAGQDGGGIQIIGYGSAITLTNSQVASNIANGAYGGIHLDGQSLLTLQNGSEIKLNQAVTGAGGGLGLNNGSISVNQTGINSNLAGTDGGGIYMSGGDLTLLDSPINNNRAGGKGGGAFRAAGDLSLEARTKTGSISQNQAGDQGGGLYDQSGTSLPILASNGETYSLGSNQAGDGGGIFATHGTSIHLSGVIYLYSNVADRNGGAIHLTDGAALLAQVNGQNTGGAAIWDNRTKAGSGGAIFAQDSPMVELSNVQLGTGPSGNKAIAGSGGGLYAANSQVHLYNVLVQNNSADVNGGGVAVTQGSNLIMHSICVITGTGGEVTAQQETEVNGVIPCDPIHLAADQYCTELINNQAGASGGGLYVERASAAVERVSFTNNSAVTGAATSVFIGSLDISSSLVTKNNGTGRTPSISHVSSGSSPSDTAIFTANNNTWADNLGMAVYYDKNTQGLFNANIVWDNTQRGVFVPTVTTLCNDTQNGYLSGIGNISKTPFFYHTKRGAYRLRGDSPAIDACPNGSSFDLDVNVRPRGGGFDMGAFETIPHLFMPFVPKQR